MSCKCQSIIPNTGSWANIFKCTYGSRPIFPKEVSGLGCLHDKFPSSRHLGSHFQRQLEFSVGSTFWKSSSFQDPQGGHQEIETHQKSQRLLMKMLPLMLKLKQPSLKMSPFMLSTEHAQKAVGSKMRVCWLTPSSPPPC